MKETYKDTPVITPHTQPDTIPFKNIKENINEIPKSPPVSLLRVVVV
jgi:hypothetical protein